MSEMRSRCDSILELCRQFLTLERKLGRKKGELVKIIDERYYAIEIKECDAVNKRVKVRYTGYDSEYDEWKVFAEEHCEIVKLENAKFHQRKSLMNTLTYFSSSYIEI